MFSPDELRNIILFDTRLNNINDVDILLEQILQEARRVTNADAGSIYILKERGLTISYAQNDTMQAKMPPGEKLIYNIFTISVDTSTLSGYCAATGQPVNIDDVYHIPENIPYSFNISYDQQSGYRTKSAIVVPLRTNAGKIIGVIQLINKLNDRNQIISFNREDELLLHHFAVDATFALQRAQMTRAILLRMIKMAEMRDPKETAHHVNRVAGYSVEIYERWAQIHRISPKTMTKTKDTLRMAAMLHDVGKVAISDVLLKKQGRFTPDEYEEIKSHAMLGAKLFVDRQSDFDECAGIVALTHHENWDGSGYPGHIDVRNDKILKASPDGKALGKQGEDIPLFGRIVSISDVYDALRTRRIYKAAWSEERTLEEMSRMSGKKFDPELLNIFFQVLSNIRSISRKYADESVA